MHEHKTGYTRILKMKKNSEFLKQLQSYVPEKAKNLSLKAQIVWLLHDLIDFAKTVEKLFQTKTSNMLCLDTINFVLMIAQTNLNSQKTKQNRLSLKNTIVKILAKTMTLKTKKSKQL